MRFGKADVIGDCRPRILLRGSILHMADRQCFGGDDDEKE